MFNWEVKNLAKKEKKQKKERVVVETPVELTKYYFLADVYAVVSVEAEDLSDAKQMIKELKPDDFINFKLKKAKLINPKLYAPVEEEDTDDEDEEDESNRNRHGRNDEDEDMEPSMA